MTKDVRNIILLGFMGTGKSSAGKIIAARLDRELIEMDCVIEKKEGMAINDIFAKKGEKYFRSCERGLVTELAVRNGQVISTGGGVVLDQRNIDDFRNNGVLFSLMAEPETVFARTIKDTHRPLLRTEDPMKKIVELLEYRRPFYENADYIIKTDGKTVEQVADEILEIYGKGIIPSIPL